MKKELILITGGARSGKSAFAQQLAQAKGKRVLFVATAEAKDEEMAERIRRHRADRPKGWDTREEPLDVAKTIEEIDEHDVALVDCLALWVSNLFLRQAEGTMEAVAEASILDAARGLVESYENGKATLILVSNEVGMGVVPSNSLGRHFRDVLGRVNQLVASRADRVYLIIAGLALELKSLGATDVGGESDLA
ncbi:MAG: bifunctional adenosylcobinamide kinase/adenosylcobinamide-phosphate guanylyltransferase [Chloroflexota bacterium]